MDFAEKASATGGRRQHSGSELEAAHSALAEFRPHGDRRAAFASGDAVAWAAFEVAKKRFVEARAANVQFRGEMQSELKGVVAKVSLGVALGALLMDGGAGLTALEFWSGVGTAGANVGIDAATQGRGQSGSAYLTDIAAKALGTVVGQVATDFATPDKAYLDLVDKSIGELPMSTETAKLLVQVAEKGGLSAVKTALSEAQKRGGRPGEAILNDALSAVLGDQFKRHVISAPVENTLVDDDPMGADGKRIAETSDKFMQKGVSEAYGKSLGGVPARGRERTGGALADRPGALATGAVAAGVDAAVLNRATPQEEAKRSLAQAESDVKDTALSGGTRHLRQSLSDADVAFDGALDAMGTAQLAAHTARAARMRAEQAYADRSGEDQIGRARARWEELAAEYGLVSSPARRRAIVDAEMTARFGPEMPDAERARWARERDDDLRARSRRVAVEIQQASAAFFAAAAERNRIWASPDMRGRRGEIARLQRAEANAFETLDDAASGEVVDAAFSRFIVTSDPAEALRAHAIDASAGHIADLHSRLGALIDEERIGLDGARGHAAACATQVDGLRAALRGDDGQGDATAALVGRLRQALDQADAADAATETATGALTAATNSPLFLAMRQELDLAVANHEELQSLPVSALDDMDVLRGERLARLGEMPPHQLDAVMKGARRVLMTAVAANVEALSQAQQMVASARTDQEQEAAHAQFVVAKAALQARFASGDLAVPVELLRHAGQVRTRRVEGTDLPAELAAVLDPRVYEAGADGSADRLARDVSADRETTTQLATWRRHADGLDGEDRAQMNRVLDRTDGLLPTDAAIALRVLAAGDTDRLEAALESADVTVTLRGLDTAFDLLAANIEAPHGPTLAAAKARLADGERLTPVETRAFAQHAAHEARGSLDTALSMLDGVETGGVAYDLSATDVFAGAPDHRIGVVRGTDGRTMLVDPGFGAFFGSGERGVVGQRLLETPRGRALAEQLVRRGHVALTADVANLLGQALTGSGRRFTPADFEPVGRRWLEPRRGLDGPRVELAAWDDAMGAARADVMRSLDSGDRAERQLAERRIDALRFVARLGDEQAARTAFELARAGDTAVLERLWGVLNRAQDDASADAGGALDSLRRRLAVLQAENVVVGPA
jgi:hypothetical protein